jgi:hypothetical protein
VTGRRGRRREKLLDDLKEIQGRSTIAHCAENYFRKRLWACRKIDNKMNE